MSERATRPPPSASRMSLSALVTSLRISGSRALPKDRIYPRIQLCSPEVGEHDPIKKHVFRYAFDLVFFDEFLP